VSAEVSEPGAAGTGDTDSALALVEGYLAARRGRLGDTESVVALSGDASTRRYYRVTGAAGCHVLALYPEPFDPETQPFLGVHALLELYGLPVPSVVDVDGGRGIVLQEDLGDRTLQNALEGCSESLVADLYREAVDASAQLQREAARGPRSAECFRIAFDIEKLSWELHYFQKHFLEGLRACDLGVEDRATLSEAFHGLAEQLASWPRVLCHRDYHSRNLMPHRGRLHWIDFQDARMGPATYDLASLLRDAYVDVPEDLHDELLERFRQMAVPEEARDLFRRRYDLMCVQRNLKALGTFGYMATVRGNTVYLPYIPRTLAHARRNLSRHPELERLWRTLARLVPELS
jgi:N-acetylmuramate 1-kinase